MAAALAIAALGFAAVDSVAIERPPFPAPSNLIQVTEHRGSCAECEDLLPERLLYAWSGIKFRTVSELTYVRPLEAVVATDGESPIRLRATGDEVSATFFDVVGVKPMLGSVWPKANEVGARVVVLGYDLWRRLGADRAAVGKYVLLGGQRFVVAAVAPYNMHLVNGAEFWVPPSDWGRGTDIDVPRYLGFARLNGRAEPLDFLIDLRAHDPDLAEHRNGRPYLFVKHAAVVDQSNAEKAWILFATACLLLFIALQNIAGLFLLRSVARQRDVAIRLAFGASIRDVSLFVLAEGLVILAFGGFAGLLLARLGEGAFEVAIGTLGMSGVPIHVGVRACLLGLLLTGVGAATTALLPIRHLRALDIQSILRENSQQVTGGIFASKLRRRLLLTEMTLAVLLLSMTLLLSWTYRAITRTDLGVDADHVASGSLVPVGIVSDSLATSPIHTSQFLSAIGAIPDVESVALWQEPRVRILRESGSEVRGVAQQSVSSDFWRLLGAEIIRGRAFSRAEQEQQAPVAVVNQETADWLWPESDPVGRHLTVFRPGHPDSTYTVVGVTSMKSSLQDGWLLLLLTGRLRKSPVVFVPIASDFRTALQLGLRTSGSQAPARIAVRVAAGLAPQWLTNEVMPLRQRFAGPFADIRRNALLGTAMTSLAVVLTMIGVYGVLAEASRNRRRELAVRSAIGASTASLISQLMREPLLLALWASAIALVVVVLTGPGVSERLLTDALKTPAASPTVIRERLFDSLIVASSLLTLAVVAASIVPAIRAARVSPTAALRE